MPKTKSLEDVALYCSFYLDDRPFAVPVLLLKELHAPAPMTPIPGAPSAVRGYVNLRGHLHVVLNPRSWLTGCTEKEVSEAYLIVFKSEAGEAFALQVDRLGDILSIRREQIDVPLSPSDQVSAGNDRSERLIIGYAKLDGMILSLVEPGELFRLCWMDHECRKDAEFGTSIHNMSLPRCAT